MTRASEKRRRSPVKGEILEWRAADLERKGNDGTYKQRAWWTLCSVRLLPSIVVVLACEGPCTTCAAWNDGISEVARPCGCRPMSWAICVSSAKRIGAQREGKLSCDGKRFDRKAPRVDEGGFGGEA